MSGQLPFVEAFGPTLQGEGPAAGRLSDFLRFGGCNLSCSWCDSAYTWNAEEFNLREQITLMDPAQVLEATPATSPLVIVTGGEPLLNQTKPAFAAVLRGLIDRGQTIHVETNGTLVPTMEIAELVHTFIVSPKMPHAGLHKRSQDPSLNPGWRGLHGITDAHMKVVVKTREDIEATVALAAKHHWPKDRVWVMPEGVTAEVLATRWPMVANTAAELGINASHRLHVLAWADARGH